MDIIRIGYCYSLKGGKSYWFWQSYFHNDRLAVDDPSTALVSHNQNKFKSYKQMMVHVVKAILRYYANPKLKFLKPFGGFLSFYRKKFRFLDSINIENHNK